MTIRLTGISNSGLDTDALIKSLMQAKRMSYNKVEQQKTQTEWKKSDYNTLYKSLTDFRNNAVFNFKLSNVLATKKAASSDEAKITATASSGATDFSHTLEVTKLATGASLSSNAAITGSLVDTTIMINGKSVIVKATDTLNDLASTINNTAGINVKANYDATLNRFFMYSTNSGSAAQIDLAGNADPDALNVLKTLKLADPADLDGPTITGEDAAFTLDGVSSTALGITTNTFTVSGVKYNLKGTTTGPVSINVSSDTDKVVASVKSFIESYNSMLDTVNTKINETKYRDFLPLSADQRAEMTDSDIKVWEEKSKSGMLRNDPALSTLASAMRNSFANGITGLTGPYTTGSSIGITTGLYTEKGKLYFNEDKLRKALESDPEIVQKIFGTDGDSASKDGIAVRLYDSLKIATDKIKIEAGTSSTSDVTSNLGKKIRDYEKNMINLNRRLNDMEESYYKKFSAMETALSKLNSQSSWLSQQLGSS